MRKMTFDLLEGREQDHGDQIDQNLWMAWYSTLWRTIQRLKINCAQQIATNVTCHLQQSHAPLYTTLWHTPNFFYIIDMSSIHLTPNPHSNPYSSLKLLRTVMPLGGQKWLAWAFVTYLRIGNRGAL